MATRRKVNPKYHLAASKKNPKVRRWQRRDKKVSTSTRAGLAIFSGTLLTLGVAAAARGRTLRNLQSLVPKVSTKSVAEFESLLKKGDLIIREIDQGRQLRTAVQRYIQTTAVGNLVHVAIYTGGGRVSHITPLSGHMAEESLSHFMRKTDANKVVIRLGTAAEGRRIAKEARKATGRYTFKASLIVPTGATAMLPLSLTKNLMKIKNGKVICATATADIVHRAGVKLSRPPGHHVTCDFRSMANPPVLHFKGAKGMVRTSPYQGAGFVIPAMALGGVAATGKVPYVEKRASPLSSEAVAAYWNEIESIGVPQAM
jgi:hypothetical protein